MADPTPKSWYQHVTEALERGHRFVTRDIWQLGLPGEELPSGFITKQIRVAILVARGVVEETLLLRASSLTFSTLLFLVPFFTLIFIFVQWFNLGEGVYGYINNRLNQAAEQAVTAFYDIRQNYQRNASAAFDRLDWTDEDEDEPGDVALPRPTEGQNRWLAGIATTPSLATNLPHLGPPRGGGFSPSEDEKRRQTEALIQQIIGTFFPNLPEAPGVQRDQQNPLELLIGVAEQTASNPQTIGLTGLTYVLITVFGMMRNIEWAFNMIWGVRGARNLWRTVSDYVMITLLLPFVMAAVLGITAVLKNPAFYAAVGPMSIFLRGGQFLLISGTFAALYYVVPNTHVKKRYAIIGGMAAGTLWLLNSWAYVTFSIGLRNYSIFFQTFALFPMLMGWLYFSWIIVLLGCLLTYAYQNERTFALNRYVHRATFAYREALCVRLAIELVRRFKSGEAGLSVPEVANDWNVPPRMINDMLELLQQAKIIAPTATEPVMYLPARDPDQVRVRDLVSLLREAGQDPSLLRRDETFREIYHGLDMADPATLEASIGGLAQHYGSKPLLPEVTPFPRRESGERAGR